MEGRCYQGETSEPNGYTTKWSDPEEGEETLSYFVKPFIESTEADFEFPLPIKELIQPEEDHDGKTETKVGREDHSLGEINVPLSGAWIR